MTKEGDIKELVLCYKDTGTPGNKIKCKCIKVYDKGLYNMCLFESLKGNYKICENEVKVK